MSRPIDSIALPTFKNGGIQVGIAVGVDTITDARRLIQVPMSKEAFIKGMTGADAEEFAKGCAIFHFLHVHCVEGTSKALIHFCATAGAFALLYGLYDSENGINYSSTNAQNKVTADAKEDASILVPDNDVAALLFATKINWYATNHHVGQNGNAVEGYAGKMLKNKSYGSEPGWKDALHQSGHYLDTATVLKAVGVPGVTNGRNVSLKVDLTDDFRKRISAWPAGCARVATIHAILKRASFSLTSLGLTTIPNMDAVDQWIQEVTDLKINAAYHVGAHILCDAQTLALAARHPMPVYGEEDQMQAAAWAHAAIPHSSLTKSAVLAKKAEVQSHTAYTSTCQLLKFMVSSEGDVTKLLKRANVAYGGFGLQHKLIKPEAPEGEAKGPGLSLRTEYTAKTTKESKKKKGKKGTGATPRSAHTAQLLGPIRDPVETPGPLATTSSSAYMDLFAGTGDTEEQVEDREEDQEEAADV